MRAMGTMVEYFGAPSDAAAAALVELGVTMKTVESKALRKARLAGDPAARWLDSRLRIDLAEEGVYAFSGGVVADEALTALEALLTGVPQAQIQRGPRASADPRYPGSAHLASEDPDEGPWIVTVTDELRDALCDTSARLRTDAASRWRESESFYYGRGQDDVEAATEFVERLADLARIETRPAAPDSR